MDQEIYLNDEITASRQRVLSRIEELRRHVRGDVLAHAGSALTLHTRYQFMFNLKFEHPLDARLFELILSQALEAEKMGPGAFDSMIENMLFRECAALPELPSTSRQATWDDIENIAINPVAVVDQQLGSIAREAVRLAGFAGRIVVEKTHSATPTVELCRGYNFEAVPAWSASARFESPRAFVIDGYIEQVSEIHHILEAASSAKEPCLLFVRGLSNDVLHTLRVNYDRGTLQVVPIIVKFDLEGINMVNDIAVVTGCDMISSNKGDLISSVKYEAAPRLKSAVVYPNKVVIHNDSTAKDVACHVMNLKAKRAEPSLVEDVGSLYDKRIRSLSHSHVVIRLPDNRQFVKFSQAVDVALRKIKTMVDHGVLNERGTVMPASTKIAAEVHSSRCLSMLENFGAIIC